MTRQEYITDLANKIYKFGYWSNEVLECNTLGQSLYSYPIWVQLHDRAKIMARTIKVD